MGQQEVEVDLEGQPVVLEQLKEKTLISIEEIGKTFIQPLNVHHRSTTYYYG